MSFKIEKPGFYRERGGEKAEVVGRTAAGEWVGVTSEGRASDYSNEGIIAPYLGTAETPCDLVAEWVEPKRIKGWLNVYDEDCQGDFHTGYIFASRQRADSQLTSKRRTACIEIDVLEGAGLCGEAGQ